MCQKCQQLMTWRQGKWIALTGNVIQRRRRRGGAELNKKAVATRMLVGFGTPKSGFKIVLREKSLKD